MNGAIKIALGAIATALLALVGHNALGEAFLASLRSDVSKSIEDQGLHGISVATGTNPLSRNVILSGPYDGVARDNAVKAAMATAGVAGVRWLDGSAAAKNSTKAAGATGDSAAPAPLDPATQAAVDSCQDDVDRVVAGKTIQFASGSAYIKPSSNALLDQVAAALKPCGKLSLAIGGHTDSTGDAQINATLSQERANRVRDALVARGLDATKISAQGFGSSQPKVSGSDAAANSTNRRIEFTVGGAATAASAPATGKDS